MHNGDGICAGAYAVEGDQSGIISRHIGPKAFGILTAIGEKTWVCRDAYKDIALIAAQAINIDLKRCSGRSGLSPANEDGGSNCQAQDQCRTFCPKT